MIEGKGRLQIALCGHSIREHNHHFEGQLAKWAGKAARAAIMMFLVIQGAKEGAGHKIRLMKERSFQSQNILVRHN